MAIGGSGRVLVAVQRVGRINGGTKIAEFGTTSSLRATSLGERVGTGICEVRGDVFF